MAEVRGNHLINFGRYLVRPNRHQGESVYGWIRRHFNSNGRNIDHRVAILLKSASTYSSKRTQQQASLVRLNSLFSDVDQIDIARWLFWYCEESRFDHQQSSWSQRNTSPYHFCPRCLEEWGYFLALWELPGVSACPRHACELMRVCPNCGSSEWQMGKGGSYRCRCNLPLKLFPKFKSHPLRIRFASLIASYSNIELPSGYHFVANSEPERISITDIYEFLMVLTAITTRSDFKLVKEQLLTAPETIGIRDLRLVKLWPKNFRRFVRRLIRSITKRYRDQGSIHDEEINTAHLTAFITDLVNQNFMREYRGPFKKMIYDYYAELGNKPTFYIYPGIYTCIYPSGTLDVFQTFVTWWEKIDRESFRPVKGLEGVEEPSEFRSKERMYLSVLVLMNFFQIALSGWDSNVNNYFGEQSRNQVSFKTEINSEMLTTQLLNELLETPIAYLHGLSKYSYQKSRFPMPDLIN